MRLGTAGAKVERRSVRAVIQELIAPKVEAPGFTSPFTGKTYKTIEELEGKEAGVTQCVLKSTGCCGLREIKDMSACDHPGEVLAIVAKAMSGVPGFPYVGSTGEAMGNSGLNYPHILFTGITKVGERRANHVSKFNKTTKLQELVLDTTYWQTFIDYLKKHNLGPVWEGPRRENSCYGNEVGVFIWNPDYPNFKAWVASHLRAVPVKPKKSETPNLDGSAYAVIPHGTATEVELVTLD